jgi:hypothetical protein
LFQVFKNVGRFLKNKYRNFRCIQFFIKKAIVIIVLVIIGIGRFYLDKTQKKFDHQIIVTPNFKSTDYLYSKNLINSKIIERDIAF